MMFTILNVKSIRPNPLMDRFDNDGPGHSFGKGVQRTNWNKDVNFAQGAGVARNP
jgi:hypothetical protein